jgi:hypothetical protein
MKNEGFSINDFDHLEESKQPGLEQRREASGWGLVREDLIKYHVHMVTDVRFVWDDNTPPEMRKVFAEASAVVHYIAEQAIMNQLKHDGLLPTEIRSITHGETEGKEEVLLRDSGWQPICD